MLRDNDLGSLGGIPSLVEEVNAYPDFRCVGIDKVSLGSVGNGLLPGLETSYGQSGEPVRENLFQFW